MELDYGKDEGDRANASLAREIDLGQKSRDHALLSAIDAALDRIRQGRFGECFSCGGEISANRLEAIPWVPSVKGFSKDSQFPAGFLLVREIKAKMVKRGSKQRLA